MAAAELDMDKIVNIFRDIVKRKTSYNETNLHYEYYKRAGDTIPFKAHGFASLRELIQKKAGDYFYFEKVGNDLEFIAPKRVDSPNVYSELNKGLQKISLVKKVEENGGYTGGSEKSKRVRVSNNIYFRPPQSTGVNNPFQNIRNDIKISFDFGSQKREVDRCTSIDSENVSDNKSSANEKQHLSSTDDVNSGIYSLARNDSDQMDIDEESDDLPWDQKYWRKLTATVFLLFYSSNSYFVFHISDLKVTHPVSTSEIWARLFDEFDVSLKQ